MADLADLKQFGQDLAPLVQNLIATWANEEKAAASDKADAAAAISQLQEVVNASGQPTVASAGERLEAMIAIRDAIRALIKQAATNSVTLTPDQFDNLQGEKNNLLDAIGRLGVISAFEPIPQLLTPAEADQFKTDIQGALDGLRAKRTAKAILDTAIDVLLIAAKIATKLAVA